MLLVERDLERAFQIAKIDKIQLTAKTGDEHNLFSGCTGQAEVETAGYRLGRRNHLAAPQFASSTPHRHLGAARVILASDVRRAVRELLYNAGGHLRRGKALAEEGNRRGALQAYADALRDLHAVKPQRQRDVLLAHVYLARYALAPDKRDRDAQHDLRVGYSYARTSAEPVVRELAESLWQQHLTARLTERDVQPERGVH